MRGATRRFRRTHPNETLDSLADHTVQTPGRAKAWWWFHGAVPGVASPGLRGRSRVRPGYGKIRDVEYAHIAISTSLPADVGSTWLQTAAFRSVITDAT